MASEGSSWGELAQFVAHHLLRDKNGDVLSAIVYSYGMTNHNWNNHG